VLLHSHPFADTAWFSSRDYRLMNNYREWITNMYDDWDLGFAVLSREDLTSIRISDDSEGFDQLQSLIVGEGHSSEPPWSGVDPEDTGNDVGDEERQSRAILAHGQTTQKRVCRMHVVIAGVGGVGSAVAEQLARLGVGKLTLVDPDIVEESNLARLIGAAPHHVDRAKVDAIRESVYRANPCTEVETIEGKLEDHEEAVKHADIIIQCVDRDVSRSSLAQLAAKHLVPVIDAGIKIIRGNGDAPGSRAVFLFNTIPGDSACFHCLGRGNPEQMRIESMNEDEIELQKEQGYLTEEDVAPKASLVNATTMAAAHACTAFMEYVDSGEMTDLFRYDMVTDETMKVTADVSPDCNVCRGGLLARGDHEVTDEELEEILEASFSDIEIEAVAK
jgi:hypothetical protein